MLDIKSRIVLKLLCKECPNGAYKIIDGGDIISAMPNKYKVDTESLQHILIYLERQDCITIKYDDENVYCISVLPYGFELNETSQTKEAPQKIRSSGQAPPRLQKKGLPMLVYFLIMFFIALCASFCANLLARLITM